MNLKVELYIYRAFGSHDQWLSYLSITGRGSLVVPNKYKYRQLGTFQLYSELIIVMLNISKWNFIKHPKESCPRMNHSNSFRFWSSYLIPRGIFNLIKYSGKTNCGELVRWFGQTFQTLYYYDVLLEGKYLWNECECFCCFSVWVLSNLKDLCSVITPYPRSPYYWGLPLCRYV